MTHTDPSADAFMRRILSNPADPVPRLVFADWLEETGTSSNLAWARYLRLAGEVATAPPDDPRRPKLVADLERVGGLVRARLTFRAEVFVAYPEAVPLLLPLKNLTVTVDHLTIPDTIAELIPASVAEESQVLPLAACGSALAVAVTYPSAKETCRMLAYFLGRDLRFVAAPADQLRAAIDRHYLATEVIELGFPHRPNAFARLPLTLLVTDPVPVPRSPDDTPITRLADLILTEAIHLRAAEVELEPHPDRVQVWYLVDGERVERDVLPARLLSPLVAQFRGRAAGGDLPFTVRGVSYHLPFRATATPNGPHVLIRVAPAPANPPAALNPAA